MSVTIADLARALDDAFPAAWAEPWDRVGLCVGDGRAPLTRAYVALDADERTIAAAAAHGAQALVCHHPPFLGDMSRVTDESAAGRLTLAALSSGIAVIAIHTNLDRSPEGAGALAQALGLSGGAPLESGSGAVDVITTFVPSSDAEAVTDAMTSAGAGRIGAYRACSFGAEGTGRFTAGPGAAPAAGIIGAPAAEAETRVEVVAASGSGGLVARAARVAHPYEEPVIVVTPGTLDRGAARLGRVCDVAETTLGVLARDVGEALSVTCRVWGDDVTAVRRVALANGSGGSLIGAAIRSGANVLVTGEVRYHDALDAMASGLAIIEAGHDATEWPLVSVLADAVARVIGPDNVHRAEPRMCWWTAERTG